MQFCVLPLEYLNVDLKCVHMVRIHRNLFSSAKLRRDFSSFHIKWKKDGWLRTDDAKTMDWLSHTSRSDIYDINGCFYFSGKKAFKYLCVTS